MWQRLYGDDSSLYRKEEGVNLSNSDPGIVPSWYAVNDLSVWTLSIGMSSGCRVEWITERMNIGHV